MALHPEHREGPIGDTFYKVRVAQGFELLLEKYRHPDGGRWNGQRLQDATGGS